MPKRIQRKRIKGWRMPASAVYVGRPTRWGNPYRIGDVVHRGLSVSGRDEVISDAEGAVNAYRRWLFTIKRSRDLIVLLQGKDLACWCSLNQPCHADVLLELANHPAVGKES